MKTLNTTRLAHRAALVAAAAVLVGASACPIGALRDGIGAACVVDADACATDHVCFLDDGDADDGLCAPIADYGDCPEPTYPQNVGEVAGAEGEAIRVESVDDIDDLDGVVTVEGNLIIDAPGAVGTIALGSLCGLSGLQQVRGSLLVSQTDLETLDGLQGLGFVGAGVGVGSNPQLRDLMGLANLMRVVKPAGGDGDGDVVIVIADNDQLSTAAIAELRAALADRPSLAIFACGNLRAGEENDLVVCPDGVGAFLGRD